MKNITERAAELGLVPVLPTPNNRQIEWYSRERMMFLHFGMNTFSDREWGDGTEDPKNFNPTELDCRQWVRAIKAAGFRSAVLTAKHHDGFCLWPSKYTEHSVKNSPYKDGKGDIVKEFTDACREYGIKAGIYLSPWDRHEPTWGSEAYNDYYANQLTELMTNYGTIWECWWDGAGSTKAHYDWDRWANVVRTLQPNAVIFGSLGATAHVDVRWVGNEKGIAGTPCWSTIDPVSLVVETTSELNSGKLDGARFIPAEVDVSIRPGWFYHKNQDVEVRTPENLMNLWFTSNGRNAGLLLNLPPDRRGLICEEDVSSLAEFAEALERFTQNNLAANAKVTASSVRSSECPPEAVLSADPESFYAPTDDDALCELVFDLGGEVEFNTVSVREVIELSHRVTGFEISAEVCGEWKLLCSGECIGNRFATRFDKISATRVKFKVTSALAAPLLREIALYTFEPLRDKVRDLSGEKADLISAPDTKITETADEYEILLGGIKPFDTLEIENFGITEMEIYVFNGTDFELYDKVSNPEAFSINYKFRESIDWAYRLKLCFTKRAMVDPIRAKLY